MNIRKKILNQLKDRPILQKTITNLLWLFSEKILRLVVGFFVSVWVSRYLGPSDFGIFSYALAFATIFAAIGSLGLDQIIIKEFVKQPQKAEQILGTSFRLLSIASCVTYGFLLISIFYFQWDDKLTLIMTSIIGSSIFFNILNVIRCFFESRIEAKYNVWVSNAALAIIASIKVVSILLEAPLLVFGIIYAFECFLFALGYFIMYSIKIGKVKKWAFNKKLSKDILRSSLPMMFSIILSTIYLKIDQIMISEYVNDKEVGLYAVAVTLTQIWFFIPTIIYNSIFPSLLKTKENNEALYYKRLQNLFNIMTIIGYILAIPISIYASFLITTIYGIPYAAAAPMFGVLIWVLPLVNLSTSRLVHIHTMNLEKTFLYITLMSCIINIVLNLIFIPLWGGLGAAIATFGTHLFSAYLSNLLFKPLRKISWLMTKAIIFPKFL